MVVSDQTLLEVLTVTEGLWTSSTTEPGHDTDEVIEVEARAAGSSAGCHTFDLVMRLGVHGGLVLLGLVGNLLTIHILHPLIHKSATFLLLYALAFADFAVVLFIGGLSVPTAVLRSMDNYRAAQRFYLQMTSLMPACISTSLQISTWLTVVVTWHRYVSVCLPYKVKKYGSVRVARWQVLAVYSLSIIYGFPKWFEAVVVLDDPKPGMTRLEKTDFATTEGYTLWYSVILNYSISYVLPIGMLVYMTTALIWALQKARSKRQEMTSGTSQSSDGLNVSLIIVVIIFLICRIFGPVRRLLANLYPSTRQCGGILFYYEPFSQAASICNSAINFLVYLLFAKRFRKMFKSVCGLPCKGSEVSPTSNSDTGSSGLQDGASNTVTTRVSQNRTNQLSANST